MPKEFREDDVPTIHAMIRAARLANLVTASAEGMIATPLPLMIDASEGPHGVLYGHIARANPQWKRRVTAEALAIFMGPESYVSPSLYATKRETGKVVPTWNYLTVHAYGVVEFFDDVERLRAVVTRLTDLHESGRADPWAVSDAPPGFIDGQLRGIVGVRMPISRLYGKKKLSQNRSAADRAGVTAGLAASEREGDRVVGRLIPE